MIVYKKLRLKVFQVLIFLSALILSGFYISCIDSVSKEPGKIYYRIVSTNCTGCLKCIAPCPFYAITEEKYFESVIAVIDTRKCTGCGECVTHCIYDAIDKYNDNPEYFTD